MIQNSQRNKYYIHKIVKKNIFIIHRDIIQIHCIKTKNYTSRYCPVLAIWNVISLSQYKCVILHRCIEHLWPWVYIFYVYRRDEEKQRGGGPGKGDAEWRRQRTRRLQVAGGSRCRITRLSGRDGSGLSEQLRWVKSWFSTLRTCCRGEPVIRSAFRILLLVSGRAPLKEETKCHWNEIPFCLFFC